MTVVLSLRPVPPRIGADCFHPVESFLARFPAADTLKHSGAILAIPQGFLVHQPRNRRVQALIVHLLFGLFH